MLDFKVGKVFSREYYIHKNALELKEYNNKFNASILELYFKAKELLESQYDFKYSFVAILPKVKIVRFLIMSPLTDPHPYVLESKKVNIIDQTILNGRITGNLYHRLNTMVSPSHHTFKFHQAVTDYEESVGLLNTPVPYTPTRWGNRIEEMVGSRKYEKQMADFKKELL
jgi:hypothetical protein